MRMWQCYLRIALRARSASGLLDALGLGYDLPVGQAVYAIDAFPDDDLLWRIEWMAVLQLCRSGLICCANAPCVIGFRSVQVEAIRTGSHPSGGWLVSAFFLVVPGRRGVARRARSARRSRHGVALGPAVCTRNGTTYAL